MRIVALKVEIANLRLDRLALSAGISSALKEANFLTVADVLEASESRLAKKLGKEKARQVRAYLARVHEELHMVKVREFPKHVIAARQERDEQKRAQIERQRREDQRPLFNSQSLLEQMGGSW